MGFAENLQIIRKKNSLTQEALADMLGVSRQAVSRWEMGEGYPEVEKLLMLSEKLGVSLDGMMGLKDLGENFPSTEAESDIQPSEITTGGTKKYSEPQSTRTARKYGTMRIVCGAVLALLGLLFFFVPFIGYLQYISFSLFLAGLACLVFRNHTALAAVWGLFIGADLYLRLINGANWKTVFASPSIKENMNPYVLSICWAFFIVGIALTMLTALILAKHPGSTMPLRENGSVDIKRIIVFVLIIVVIWALFHIPFMKIFGITELAKDPNKYETLYNMIRVNNIAHGIADSAAVALIAIQLGKVLSWIKQLIKRHRIKSA